MRVARALGTGVKVGAVCLVFALSFVIGATLSGVTKSPGQPPAAKTVQDVPPSQQQAISPVTVQESGSRPQAPEMPGNFLLAFAIFSACAGTVVSYLILRSRWHGWRLAGSLFISIYGTSIVATQVESLFFLSAKMPPGLIAALFLQGAIATALFVPVAMLLLGKWRLASTAPARPAPAPLRVSSAAWTLALIVIAFVFLYMFFGYYVAWQNPALRQYYGGSDYSSFFAMLKANWSDRPSIYLLQVFRGLLYAACLYPLVRMLRTTRWETGLAMALFLSVWTTALLLPNPIMPPSVAHSHLWETLGFSLVFGSLAGWLLNTPAQQSGDPLIG